MQIGIQKVLQVGVHHHAKEQLSVEHEQEDPEGDLTWIPDLCLDPISAGGTGEEDRLQIQIFDVFEADRLRPNRRSPRKPRTAERCEQGEFRFEERLLLGWNSDENKIQINTIKA